MNYLIKEVDKQSVISFLDKYHYLGGNKGRFYKAIYKGLYQEGILVGVAVFALPNGRINMEKNMIELRRFCLIDGLEKNTASWFLSRLIKELKKEKVYTKIVSYACKGENHKGTIYKASNFVNEGEITGQIYYKISEKDNKKIYKRQVYYKNKDGKYLDSSKILQNQIKSGELKKFKEPSKTRFTFLLK